MMFYQRRQELEISFQLRENVWIALSPLQQLSPPMHVLSQLLVKQAPELLVADSRVSQDVSAELSDVYRWDNDSALGLMRYVH